jgi:Fe-Mn family superoxide dismutase
MAYKLPDLPYAFDALEPSISEETMRLHYTKHHRAYVDKLNEALKDYPKYSKYAPEVLVSNWKKLPKAIQEAVRNQGGGHVNHSLFWTLMKKDGSDPTGNISVQINKDFGSFEKFKKKFNEAGTKQFGSGWVWLIYVGTKLRIITTPNQDSPLTNGDWPIMGIDGWEHAWAYQWKNEKDKYYKAIWNVWNWTVIDQRFKKAQFFADKKPVKSEVRKQYGL